MQPLKTKCGLPYSPPISLRAPLFLASWVIMMVAMMFPTAAPMILGFHRVEAVKYQLDVALVSTWVFVGAYLLVWAFAGIAAYAGVLVVETAAARAALTPAAEAQVGGAIIMIAGILPAHAIKGAVPLTVSHAHPLHYDVMA